MEEETVYCLCRQPYDETRFMIECDVCKDWFHGSCVQIHEHQASDIEIYHCPNCKVRHGPLVVKQRRNWHRHDYSEPPDLRKPYITAPVKGPLSHSEGKKTRPEAPVQTGTVVFIKELKKRQFPSGDDIPMQRLHGSQLTVEYLEEHGFRVPILVEKKDGLGMIVPPTSFSIRDVENYVGSMREVDVIDVGKQEEYKMLMREWTDYYYSPNRSKIFNIISLEFSTSKLAELVQVPTVVRKLSWVHNLWPDIQTDDAPYIRPDVQKYCLMGVKDSFTDFHVDFGGTSVWYHALKGEKVFYLVRPSRVNLELYEQWSESDNRSETFFGDLVDRCYKCTVKQGQTLFIPTGWIHAVLTPIDSLVFGGNFLHSLNMELQLRIYDIEQSIPTPEKYLFPSFEAVHWYAAKHLVDTFREHHDRHQDKKLTRHLEGGSISESRAYLIDGARALLPYLKQWVQQKDYAKSQKSRLPEQLNFSKIVKDLAKELKHIEKSDPRSKADRKRKKRSQAFESESDTELSPLKINESSKENKESKASKKQKKKSKSGKGRGNKSNSKKRTSPRRGRKRTASESRESVDSDDTDEIEILPSKVRGEPDRTNLDNLEIERSPPKKRSKVKIKVKIDEAEKAKTEVKEKENSPYDFDGSDSEIPMSPMSTYMRKVKSESPRAEERKSTSTSDSSLLSSPDEHKPLKGLSVLAPLKMRIPRDESQMKSEDRKSYSPTKSAGYLSPGASSPTKSPTKPPLFASPKRLLPAATSLTSLGSSMSSQSMTSQDSESEEEMSVVDESPGLRRVAEASMRPSLKLKLSVPPGALDTSFSDRSATQSDLNTSQESIASTGSRRHTRTGGDDVTIPSSRINMPEIRGGLNGSIADILEASGYGTETDFKIDDNLGSPSMRDAIGGLLSMRMGAYQSITSQEVFDTKSGRASKVAMQRARKAERSEDANDGMKTVYNDDDYAGYPALRLGCTTNTNQSTVEPISNPLSKVYTQLEEDSDDETEKATKHKPRRDDSWAPKAKIIPNCPKPDRPHREGVRKEAVESGLAAAKMALETKPTKKRQYIRKKSRPDKPVAPSTSAGSSLGYDLDARPGTSGLQIVTDTIKAPSSPAKPQAQQAKKAKKGMATAKQRLGKILKIHKMMR